MIKKTFLIIVSFIAGYLACFLWYRSIQINILEGQGFFLFIAYCLCSGICLVIPTIVVCKHFYKPRE